MEINIIFFQKNVPPITSVELDCFFLEVMKLNFWNKRAITILSLSWWKAENSLLTEYSLKRKLSNVSCCTHPKCHQVGQKETYLFLQLQAPSFSQFSQILCDNRIKYKEYLYRETARYDSRYEGGCELLFSFPWYVLLFLSS